MHDGSEHSQAPFVLCCRLKDMQVSGVLEEHDEKVKAATSGGCCTVS